MQALNKTRQRMLADALHVADTFLGSLMGLMGKPPLAEGQGLWIVPCQSVHTFWMRFPIDVVFLDKGRRVIHLVEHLKPFRISKHVSKAASVLELPVSMIHRSGTELGDQIVIVPSAQHP